MARNEGMPIPGMDWTQVSNADVTSVRLQNLSPMYEVYLLATAGAVKPVATDPVGAGAMRLPPGTAISAGQTLADLFPGVPGANRLWVWSYVPAQVSVSHA